MFISDPPDFAFVILGIIGLIMLGLIVADIKKMRRTNEIIQSQNQKIIKIYGRLVYLQANAERKRLNQSRSQAGDRMQNQKGQEPRGKKKPPQK